MFLNTPSTHSHLIIKYSKLYSKRPIGKLFPSPTQPDDSKEVVIIPSPNKGRPSNFSSKENLVSPGSAPIGGYTVGAGQNKRSSVTRQISMPDASPQTETSAGDGPFNFRQHLRKTEFAPTDTLKKMKARTQSIDE